MFNKNRYCGSIGECSSYSCGYNPRKLEKKRDKCSCDDDMFGPFSAYPRSAAYLEQTERTTGEYLSKYCTSISPLPKAATTETSNPTVTLPTATVSMQSALSTTPENGMVDSVQVSKVERAREPTTTVQKDLISAITIHPTSGVEDTVCEKEEEACVMCLENNRIMALIPCGHRLLCYACVCILASRKPGNGDSVAAETKCPACRATVTSAVRIFC